MGATASAAASSGPRFGIIGGSGVQIAGGKSWVVKTPFGDCQLSALDDSQRVLFASRHNSTSFDSTGKVKYAPPHEVNYKALVWALVVESGCAGGIVALGSSGSLDPEKIPIGSVVIADDYYMVTPEPMTFWGNDKVGSFEVPEGGVGRMHYSPADLNDERWVAFCQRVQAALQPLLVSFKDKVPLAAGQTAELWPLVHSTKPGGSAKDSTVYVQTVGPRFETRAEIRAYRAIGHVLGMTCGREWALCEELRAPYCLVCFCDNACNGLSSHPGGALQEYLEHKQTVSEVTGAVVAALVADFSKS